MDARSFRELGIECDYRHALELAGGDHYAVGGGGVGGLGAGEGGRDQPAEQRMRPGRAGQELRMRLRADEERVLRQFGELHQVPVRREPTIRDLMRHTAGFTYGAFSDTPVDRMYREKRMLDRNAPLSEFVTKLTTIPLLYQPGTHFHYSVGVDVLGRVVEVVSGTSLDQFFHERIFKPLDMRDTGFHVPANKIDRFAANYGPDPRRHGLRMIDDPDRSPYLEPPKFFSGGGGLVSTARDYTRFCQMLLDEGQLQGTRLLKRETVQMMTKNQLPPEALPMEMTAGAKSDKGLGFGLGFGVRTAPNVNEPSDVVGEYYWGGAASTGFTICPHNRTVIIALTQFMPFTPKLSEAFKRAVNAAVETSEPRAAVQ